MIAPFATLMIALSVYAGNGQDAKSVTPVRFEPQIIDVVRDSTGYVQAMVNLFSVTRDSIHITGIKGSCGCATASVQRPLLHDSVPGKIYLAINAHHFVDSLNYVDYTISHTGSSSPVSYRVIVRLPKSKP